MALQVGVLQSNGWVTFFSAGFGSSFLSSSSSDDSSSDDDDEEDSFFSFFAGSASFYNFTQLSTGIALRRVVVLSN